MKLSFQSIAVNQGCTIELCIGMEITGIPAVPSDSHQYGNGNVDGHGNKSGMGMNVVRIT